MSRKGCILLLQKKRIGPASGLRVMMKMMMPKVRQVKQKNSREGCLPLLQKKALSHPSGLHVMRKKSTLKTK